MNHSQWITPSFNQFQVSGSFWVLRRFSAKHMAVKTRSHPMKQTSTGDRRHGDDARLLYFNLTIQNTGKEHNRMTTSTVTAPIPARHGLRNGPERSPWEHATVRAPQCAVMPPSSVRFALTAVRTRRSVGSGPVSMVLKPKATHKVAGSQTDTHHVW